MPFTPTKAQELAINEKGNILVAAAAGSGKTAVLVERVISLLTNNENPINADRLLIVTFTNAAAAEMRSRIEKRLDEECRKNPNNIGLLIQKHLLPTAKICTIDSFCIDLVRENFEKLNVSPDFKISDGFSLRAIDEDVLYKIINRYLEEDNKVFFDLLDIVGAEYDEKEFCEFVLRIYNFSRQLSNPQKWFKSLAATFSNGCYDRNSIIYLKAFEIAKETILNMQNELSVAIDLSLEVEKAATAYYETFSITANSLNELLQAANSLDWDLFYNTLGKFYLQSLPTVRGLGEYSQINSAKEIYKSYLPKQIETLQKIFYANFEFINNQYKYLKEPLALLSDILIEFEQELFNEYNKNNTFTFHNIEHLALKLLCREEDGKITVQDGADEFLDRFDEVMVDEYQDTNDLQDMLFYILSNREQKLFVVGDVKQSIYGFRGANPENFLNKKNSYLPIENQNNSSKKIILGNNFRSKDEICDFVNYFFEIFMNEKTGKIIYNEEEKLIPSSKFPSVSSPAVDFNIIDCFDSDVSEEDLEACRIADYINLVMNSGECIKADENNLRKAKYSDFAILIRNTKDKAASLANRLREFGIPVNYSLEGFAETIEISTFLSLLKVIDNPKSDTDLLAVMMSPIFAFSPDEMAKIRIIKRKGDLFSAVIATANNGNQKVLEFIKKLEYYRLLAASLPLEKLISKVLHNSEYLNIVASMFDGVRRKNNLLLLCEYAVQFSQTKSNSISAFVKYIIKNSEMGLKSASINAGDDSVKIMSLHASKGLQFPVCIIANLSNNFNDVEARSNALFSTKYGLGFRYFDEELKKKITTVDREVILENARKSRLEEELRLLYVGMTRAQDKLLFVSTYQNAEKSIEKYRTMLLADNSKFSASLFSKTKSYSDWLILSLLLHPNGDILRGTGHSFIPLESNSKINIEIFTKDNLSLNTKTDNFNTDFSVDEEKCKQIKENTAFVYPYEPLISIQSKSSVSAIANKAESNKFAFTNKPSFLTEKGISATGKGTALHKVMEFIDFNNINNLSSEIERLYEWQYISEAERDSLNIKALERFFESDLFKRIKNAKSYNREMRFLTEVSACKIDSTLDKKFENENVVIQGAVDICFVEDDGVVILDFKTDRVENENQLIEAYSHQLEIYALACEKIFNLKVKQKIIYSFALSKEIIL